MNHGLKVVRPLRTFATRSTPLGLTHKGIPVQITSVINCAPATVDMVPDGISSGEPLATMHLSTGAMDSAVPNVAV